MRPGFATVLLQRRRSRPGAFAVYLAVRTLVTAGGAIVAAVALNRYALPGLAYEVQNVPVENIPAWVSLLLENRGVLPYVPVPGLVLSLAALLFRPMRGLLAGLAMVATMVGVLLIVATLLAGVVPLYQTPADMGFGGR